MTSDCPSQDQLTIGPSVKVCLFNTEGISRAKCEILTKLLINNDVDVVMVQETHTDSNSDLYRREKISGYKLVTAIHHTQMASRSTLKLMLKTSLYCTSLPLRIYSS